MLQGPFRRRAEVWLLAAQHHADQARPPGRVFPAEAQGGLQNGLRGLRGGLPTSVVRGEESVLTAPPESAEQMTDGPRGEAQGRGDRRTVLAILEAPPDGLADGHGEGARHGAFSVQGLGVRANPECMPIPMSRQNFVSGFRGTTLCRVTSSCPPGRGKTPSQGTPVCPASGLSAAKGNSPPVSLLGLGPTARAWQRSSTTTTNSRSPATGARARRRHRTDKRFRAGGVGEARGEVNARYGNDPGATFYTHVCDS